MQKQEFLPKKIIREDIPGWKLDDSDWDDRLFRTQLNLNYIYKYRSSNKNLKI